MFHVCLVQPLIDDFYATPIRNIPLGLLSIGASLKAKHKVSLLDLRHPKPHRAALPEELADVSAFYRPNDASPFSLYKSYSRYGTQANDIARLIPEDADVFLISALFSAYIHEALEVITLIRQKNKQSSIIAGGSGAMFHSSEFFNAGTDFIIQGEGEIACNRLLDELEQAQPDFAAVPNLVWQNGGNIYRNPVDIIDDIDQLSFPDYSIPGTPEYTLNGKHHAMLMASRGCVYRCEFCSIYQVFGTKYRLRSVDHVLAGLDDKIQLGFRSFDFEDDHFGGNSRWLNQLLDRIIARFSSYDLSFQAMNGITASNLDETILEKMKQAGFSGINLSLVTPDQTRQDALKRPFDTRQFTDIVEAAHRIGLKVTAYLIIGLPGDTVEDNLKSIFFLANLPVLIGPSLFYLVPGTPIFGQLQKESKIPKSPRCYRSSYFPYERPEFSRTAAMTLFRICRIINFLKAIKEYHYQPSEYRIEDDAIIIPPDLSGKQSQITLGFALLELLKQTGKIYGTGKKIGGQYPLVVEKVDGEPIRLFLSFSSKNLSYLY
ncbi:MAG: radical SAM protein [Candidatus Marinimicrobia bacterium]|nr:radical SAM protein [Candidatus Neomarinimicrobiota bacterium]